MAIESLRCTTPVPVEAAVEDAAALLAELADGGRVLELGLGTGRLALPLAARGVDVEGVDASASMVAKLEAKPSGIASGCARGLRA